MKTQEENKVKIFVEDLEETILRLHVQLRNWEEQYDQFRKKPRLDRKQFNIIHARYVYYQGKFYAYYHVLLHLGSDVPKVLTRLRGIKMTSAVVTESKAHYTEIYGHFPSKELLEIKKATK